MEAYCDLRDRLSAAEDESTQIDIVRQLAPYTSDWCVLKSLCRLAVETESQKVREAVVESLKDRAETANRIFISHGRTGKDAKQRQGALYCLGLIGCTYHDSDVLAAFEEYFARNRFQVCLTFLKEGYKKLKATDRARRQTEGKDRPDSEIFVKSV